MRVFIKPMTKSMRYNIIKEMSPEQKKEAAWQVFLSERAYPPHRGRPPKYDFLYVFVTDIDEAGADKVKGLLVEKTGRSVIYLSHSWRGEPGFAFLLPWRSPVDGKALPNKIKFFDGIRKEIMEAFGESDISSYGKVPEKGHSEELAPAESLPEETETGDLIAEEEKAAPPEAPAETREEEKEEIIKEINVLKRREAELKKELESVERLSRFMPTYKSKKKKITKELETVDLEIRMLEVKMKSLG